MTTPRRRRQPRAGSIGPGISPKANAADAYEKELRRKILNPWVNRIQRRIDSAGQEYERIRQAIANIPLDPDLDGLSRDVAARHMDRMKRQHTAEFTRKMSRYLGVNVGPMTPDLGVERLMETAISDNVNLIKTIPVRYHNDLKTRLETLAQVAPFDQQALKTVLATNYQSSGYNLRRLTRDQTSKLIGNLNQARQEQIGITHYVWQTSEDERVRRTHRDNNGKTFRWDQPSPITGHPGYDVQCRCVSLPVMPDAPIAPAEPPSVVSHPPTVEETPFGPRPQTGPAARAMIDDIYSRSTVQIDALLAEEQLLKDRYWTLQQRLAKKEIDALDIGTDEFDRLTQTREYIDEYNRVRAADEAYTAIQRARVAAETEARQDALQNVRRHVLAHGDEGPNIPYQIIGDVTAVRQEAIDNGVAEFRRIVRRWEKSDGSIPDPVTYEVGGRGRAYYQTMGRKVRVYDDKTGAPPIRTIIHETGHAYDDTNPAYLQSNIDHLYSRTAREPKRRLGANYDASEMSRPDEFFTAYVGKHYAYPTSPQGAQLSFLDKGRSIVQNPYNREKDRYITGSEITSMALEYAWAQPEYLAKADPRLFDWVFETVMR